MTERITILGKNHSLRESTTIGKCPLVKLEIATKYGGLQKMSLQNPSYSIIELTKRILEIEALSDYDKSERTVYYYVGNDYVDEKEEYTNTYMAFKKGNEIAIKEFVGPDEVIETSRFMTIEDFAQFANNNKLQLFSFHKNRKKKH